MKRPLRNDSNGGICCDDSKAYVERTSWSVREVEWFTSEKRLLFIAEDPLERDFWIMNINKACEGFRIFNMRN